MFLPVFYVANVTNGFLLRRRTHPAWPGLAIRVQLQKVLHDSAAQEPVAAEMAGLLPTYYLPKHFQSVTISGKIKLYMLRCYHASMTTFSYSNISYLYNFLTLLLS